MKGACRREGLECTILTFNEVCRAVLTERVKETFNSIRLIIVAFEFVTGVAAVHQVFQMVRAAT